MSDWQTVCLGDLLKVRNGRSQRNIEVDTGRYPILATGGEIGRTDTALYDKPSVLIGRKGTINRPQLQETPFWTVDTLFYTEVTKRADVSFLYYLFCSIDWLSLNEATGVPSLTGRRIESVEVTVPEFIEQVAISRILKDADALIRTLQLLVEKEQNIKQGMTQELLTGRIRLPGFTGAWTTTQLSRVLKFQPGFPFSSQYFTDKPVGPRLVRNRDLRAEDAIVYYTGPVPSDFVLARGDVLVGMDGDFEPKVWFQPGALLNQRVGRLRFTTSIDGAFLAHALVDPLKVLQGETGATTVKHLSHSDVEQLELLLPSVAEQRAIARALDDAGGLIASLERRLETARAIKQGMTQELLSGRTRLPVEEAVA